jgi:succinate dehydrogenase/fumarate reductase flavoprotein subunit
MSSPFQQIVVIGAGYAGLVATMRLAGKTRRPIVVFFVEGERGRVRTIRVVGNPDKLKGL